MAAKLKINISSKELAAITDPSVFYIKHEITEKLYTAFAQLIEKVQDSHVYHEFEFPQDTDIALGKITKGENYLKLPYLILDFPRYINKPNVFLFRTMFWWGKYFIFTLHISGPDMHHYYQHFLDNFENADKKKLYFCISKNQWKHSLGKTNYTKLNTLSKAEIIDHFKENEFLKMSIRLPIKNYKKLLKTGVGSFEHFMELISKKVDQS